MYVNLSFTILRGLFDKLMPNAHIHFSYYYVHVAIFVKASMSELIVLSFLLKTSEMFS